VDAANLNREALIADIGTAGTRTGDALRAAYLPKWKPSTAYAAGEPVLNPSGQTVTANSAFTSGATYSAANWTVVSGGAGGTVSDATTTGKGIVQLAGDLAGTAAAPTVAKIGGVTPAAVATSGAYSDLTGRPTIPTVAAAGTAGAALSATDATTTNPRTPTAHTHPIADLTATGTRDITTFLRGDGTWATTPAAAGAADATTTSKGLVQLAGDLAGTATAPTVPGLAGKLTAAANLSDVANVGTARTNLGLGTAATQPASAFDAAGAAAAVLPTQTGNSGRFLTTNGTAASWGTPAGGGGSSASPVTTVATAGASQTLTVPAHGTAAYDVTASAATCTFTITGGTAGEECWLTLYLHQDATGGRSWAFPSGVRWPNGGVTPTFSANASQYDIVSLVTTDGGTSFTGFLSGTGWVTPAPPAAPSATTLTGSSGNAQNILNWTAAAANGATVTNYKVYRGTTTGAETLLTTVGNVLTYTDTGLTNGTAYFYKVSAVNSVGEGALSNEISETPAAGGGGTSIATETFTAADSATALYNNTGPVGKTTDTGSKVWGLISANGGWGISSNTGYQAAGSVPGLLAIDSGVTDYTVQVDVTFSGAVNDSGLLFRATDGSNWINFIGDPGGWYFQKMAAGAQANAAHTTETVTAGTYTLKVVLSGSTLTGYVNNVQKLTYTITDSSLLTGKKVGLASGSTTSPAHFDNFSVTTP
jgi:hypothetical protein